MNRRPMTGRQGPGRPLRPAARRRVAASPDRPRPAQGRRERKAAREPGRPRGALISPPRHHHSCHSRPLARLRNRRRKSRRAVSRNRQPGPGGRTDRGSIGSSASCLKSGSKTNPAHPELVEGCWRDGGERCFDELSTSGTWFRFSTRCSSPADAEPGNAAPNRNGAGIAAGPTAPFCSGTSTLAAAPFPDDRPR